MGKQTPVAATLDDEQLLLGFLRANADIRLIEAQATTPEALWADSFAPALPWHRQYYIWNTAFDWQPELAQVNHPKALPESRGLFYFANLHTAPVVEFDRSDFALNRFGRIYWSKDFAAPHALAYDVAGFDRWYQSIVRWIRKHGKRLKIRDHEAYFLPGAAAAVASRPPNSP